MLHSITKGDENEITSLKLNDREIEFLQLAATELTYKEIADQMCISARTVDGYRDQLFEKLQIKRKKHGTQNQNTR